ncbi:hypothetical protein CDIFMA2_15490 [Clostridioides difficile]|nr:hypothetical protein CDIFMA2_15490 [Clostridioides difficile]
MAMIIVAIILMLLGIVIFIGFMPGSLVLLASLIIIYFVRKKQRVMCITSYMFLIFTIYLYAVWEDISPYTEEKMAILEEQQKKEESEKEIERIRKQEEIDKEKREKKYGKKISVEELKAKLEELVPQEYKGSHYKVDVVESGFTQFYLTVQNEKFENTKECQLFIKYITEELKDFKIDCCTFEFYTKDDGGRYNRIYIQYYRKVQTGEESALDLHLSESDIMTDEEIQKGIDEAEKKKYQSYVDPLDQIKRLKELLDSGAITQEEYNKKKKELLE